MDLRANRVIRGITYRIWKFKGETTVNAGGVECRVPVDSLEEARAVYNVKYYERKLLEELLNDLENGETVMDVGANIGIITCLAAKKSGKKGEIIAIEPFGPNADKMEDLVSKNEISNVNVFRKALSNRREKIRLEKGQEGSVDGVVNIVKDEDGDSEAIMGDDLIEDQRLDTPGVIKVDVEGAEGPVMEGLQETLRKEKCSKVLVEIHHPTEEVDRKDIKSYGWSAEKLKDFLRERGFSIEIIEERPAETHVSAEKKAPVRKND